MPFRFVKKNPDTIGKLYKIGIYIGVPGLGDLLFIIPLFRAFRQAHPDAEIVFIGKLLHNYVRPVFDSCTYIDRLLDYHFYETRSLKTHIGFIRELRQEKFNLIVDTQRKFVPSMFLSLGGPRFIVGYSSRGVFSDFIVDTHDRNKRHTSDLSLDLARAVGIDNPNVELEITIPDENTAYAARFFSENDISETGLLAGMIPSAGHHSRNWKADSFAQLADRLYEESGCKIIFFGADADREIIENIIGKMSAPALVEDFNRKSILDSAALMARCNVIVGNDSGPLHVADAAGVPCVGIYGPTLPERFGLLGPETTEICLYTDCAPCSVPECKHRRCLDDITVDQVCTAARRLIGNNSTAR